jgi:hypothetical protein
MPFDGKAYAASYLEKQNPKRGLHDSDQGLPNDLLERYAVDLSASEGEVRAQVAAVREYWNKAGTPGRRFADIAQQCRSADEELRTEYGEKMLQKSWWAAYADQRRQSAAGDVDKLVEQLKSAYGQLGVITQPSLDAAATRFGIPSSQAREALREAGLTVIGSRPLPDPPIKDNRYEKIAVQLQTCGARTIPGLLHPNSGQFRLLDGYECLGDPSLRLDLPAVITQVKATEKLGVSTSNTARTAVLQLLKTAAGESVDITELALAHLVDLAREIRDQGALAVRDTLTNLGLAYNESAVVAALLEEEEIPGAVAGASKVDQYLGEGRLGEARRAAESMPDGSDERAKAVQRVEAARALLDSKVAEIRAAVQAGDEVGAASRVRELSAISRDDADELLVTVPMPPVGGLRLVDDDDAVKLVWQPGAGHDEATTYVVVRSDEHPPSSLVDGYGVAKTTEVTAVDRHSLVARATHYSVFATAPRRPSSRPTSASITVLPAVENAAADVGPSDVTFRWSTHPACVGVELFRVESGKGLVPLPVEQNSCHLTDLPEGVPVHVQITALYRDSNGGVLKSDVTHLDATPRSAAQAIARLRARPVVVDGAIRLRVSFTPVDNSEVRILRSDGPSPCSPGSWITQQELAQFGAELTGPRSKVKSEIVMDADLRPGIHHLVAVSIGGTGIVVGASTIAGVTDPIRNPSATPFGTYATLSWEWPETAQIAEVHWEVDGSEDIFEIDRAKYASEGGARVTLGRTPCKVEIRAIIHTQDGSFAAPAVGLVIEERNETEVRYSVSSSPGLGSFGGRSKKVTFLSTEGCSGVHVQVIASPGSVMPLSAEGKFVLLDERLELQPGKPAEYRLDVPKAISKPYWVRCFPADGNVRLLDPPISDLKD